MTKVTGPRIAQSQAPIKPKSATKTPPLEIDTVQTEVFDAIGGNQKVAKPIVDPAIAAVVDEVKRVLDVAAAQAIVQRARARLSVDSKTIDAEHAEVKAKPIPRTAQEMVSVLLDRLRIGGAERTMVEKAVQHVIDGVRPPKDNMMPIGGENTVRDHITQMAITDEGPDHLLMTLADPRMTKFRNWTHMERINRVDANGNPTADAQPYALPPETLVGLIRLFTGNDAPSTVFYGRPNFLASVINDGVPAGFDDAVSAGLQNNKETAVRGLQMLARQCFNSGVSEVKVAMDGMNRAEVVKFMKAVVEPLNLEPGRYISTAFNLPRGLKDLGVAQERPNAPLREQLLEVGRRAIEAAQEGGGGKVTLDSASPTPPSTPLIEYFGARNLVDWVHEAHQAGLETYVSGGMEARHFPLLALTGVDGVGVGGAIHETTPLPGIMGRMEPSRVIDAHERATQTEMSWPGQVIYLLRRLDSVEGSSKELNDTERALQSRAHGLLRTWAEGVDSKLDPLKAKRDSELASLREKKESFSAQEFTTKSKAVESEFKAAFEQMVNEELASPTFVAKSQELAELGAASGYPLRVAPKENNQ
jgi:hypothetical protein